MKKYGNILKWFFATVILSAITVIVVIKVFFPSFVLYNEALGILKSNYIDELDEKTLIENSIKGMALGIGDPYTSYYTVEEWEELKESNSGEMFGIGITVKQQEDNILVIGVEENTPAARAGIKVNDLIVEINKKSTDSITIEDAVKEIKNIEKELTLKIKRGKKTLTVKPDREKIVHQNVKSDIIDGVGYLKIVQFDLNVFEQFKSEYEKIQDKCDNLIIDVRDNPGGDYDQVVKIADYILPEATIIYLEDRNEKREYEYSDKECIDKKICIMINGNSASASEALTGALVDNNYAVSVGTKSYGKGTSQSLVTLSDGSGLYFTSAKYYTPSGKSIHGVGIKPTHVVRQSEKYKDTSTSEIPYNEDVQLQWAIENAFK